MLIVAFILAIFGAGMSTGAAIWAWAVREDWNDAVAEWNRAVALWEAQQPKRWQG